MSTPGDIRRAPSAASTGHSRQSHVRCGASRGSLVATHWLCCRSPLPPSEAVEPTTHEPLPLELPDATPAVTCWYCGTDRGPFEREHQLPVSRGGGEVAATALVW